MVFLVAVHHKTAANSVVKGNFLKKFYKNFSSFPCPKPCISPLLKPILDRQANLSATTFKIFKKKI
jgi:hypothetical protein